MPDLLIGCFYLLGFCRGQLDHFFGQTLGNQLVWMMLTHQSAIGFFKFTIASVSGYPQHLVGVIQGGLSLAG